mmetsp:Transcript_24630/g.27499  ORF Transcript_24630/g.27499 Transcript_24630/m.27499 type:complete len:334 (+) Transcript_24630:1175-2176(+)
MRSFSNISLNKLSKSLSLPFLSSFCTLAFASVCFRSSSSFTSALTRFHFNSCSFSDSVFASASIRFRSFSDLVLNSASNLFRSWSDLASASASASSRFRSSSILTFALASIRLFSSSALLFAFVYVRIRSSSTVSFALASTFSFSSTSNRLISSSTLNSVFDRIRSNCSSLFLSFFATSFFPVRIVSSNSIDVRVAEYAAPIDSFFLESSDVVSISLAKYIGLDSIDTLFKLSLTSDKTSSISLSKSSISSTNLALSFIFVANIVLDSGCTDAGIGITSIAGGGKAAIEAAPSAGSSLRFKISLFRTLGRISNDAAKAVPTAIPEVASPEIFS